jgi:hypothetical protein
MSKTNQAIPDSEELIEFKNIINGQELRLIFEEPITEELEYPSDMTSDSDKKIKRFLDEYGFKQQVLRLAAHINMDKKNQQGGDGNEIIEVNHEEKQRFKINKYDIYALIGLLLGIVCIIKAMGIYYLITNDFANTADAFEDAMTQNGVNTSITSSLLKSKDIYSMVFLIKDLFTSFGKNMKDQIENNVIQQIMFMALQAAEIAKLRAKDVCSSATDDALTDLLLSVFNGGNTLKCVINEGAKASISFIDQKGAFYSTQFSHIYTLITFGVSLSYSGGGYITYRINDAFGGKIYKTIMNKVYKTENNPLSIEDVKTGGKRRARKSKRKTKKQRKTKKSRKSKKGRKSKKQKRTRKGRK